MAPRFNALTVADVTPETASAVAISFDVPAELAEDYAFQPGQYLTLRAKLDGEEVRRSYSICSAPGDGRLSVGIKHVDGGAFSTFANGTLKAGDRLDVMTPEGRFTWNGKDKDLLLIAAGSGITPMMSIAETALAQGARITLVYGNRASDTIMFRDRLEALKDTYLNRLTVIHVLSREGQDVPLLEGRLGADKLDRMAATGAIDPKGADGVYLCGPGELIDMGEAWAKAQGVSADHIHHERFTVDGEAPRAPSQAAKDAAEAGVAVEVILDGSRKGFRMGQAGQSLVDAAHDQGLELPFSCKGGMCCTCRCRIVEGSADLPVNYSLEPWELEAGFTLACQAQPTSDKLVLDFDAA